jgi:hypothetical protein
VFADGPADLITVHARQHDVEQDQDGVAVQRQVQALLTILGCQDFVALGFEGVLEAPQQGGLILDDQDLRAVQTLASM